MQPHLKLIGISGTNGSGKDTVGTLLAQKHDFWFISVTELLREECRKRNLPVERENLRLISAEWRREYGFGVLVDKAVDAFNALADKEKYVGIVTASLRNPHEADRIHELGGTMVWVDADPRIRYERVQANAAARGRSAEDTKTFGQFLVEEEAEMRTPDGGDEAMLNMSAVKERCDLFLENNGNDINVLEQDMLTTLGLG